MEHATAKPISWNVFSSRVLADDSSSPSGSRARSLLTKALCVLAFVAAVFAVQCVPAGEAYADLNVYVGYAGGPYYKKAYFTDDQLWSMSSNQVYEYYSFDNGGYLRKGYGQGVELQRVLNSAGINPEAMWRFYLSTDDGYREDDGGYGANGDAWYYSTLCGTTRYTYPTLQRNVVFDNYGFPQIYSDLEARLDLQQNAQVVPSILALRSSFSRISSLDSPVWDTPGMSSNSGYRLMYGQTSPYEGTARESAQLVRSITCILGGEDGTDVPEIDFGIDNITGEIGDQFTIRPGLTNVMDQLIADKGVLDINWESSDNDVFTVRKNADGTITITIVGEGSASLGASFGNSPYGEFISQGSKGISGTPGRGDGLEGGGKGEEDSGGDDAKDSSGAQGIVLSKGTNMFQASLQQVSSAGEGSGDDGFQGGGDNGGGEEGETQATEDVSEESADVLAVNVPTEPEPQVSELIFDDLDPLAEPETQQGDPGRRLLEGGLLLAIGGLVQAGRYQAAKDRVPKEARAGEGAAE